MSNTNNNQTTNQQQIDWAKTILYNILVFIGEYIISLFGYQIILGLFDAEGTNTERGGYVFSLIGEKADYNGIIYGGYIKLPLIFLVFLNFLILIFWRRLPFKLFKLTK
jgi:hypothetical protein